MLYGDKQMNDEEFEEWAKKNSYFSGAIELQAHNQQRIQELEAHIEELRKATENYILEGETSLAELEKALASTPIQSLQAHDDEVIERCAQACGSRDGSWADCEWNDAVKSCEEAIRALKGKQNE